MFEVVHQSVDRSIHTEGNHSRYNYTREKERKEKKIEYIPLSIVLVVTLRVCALNIME